MVRQLVDRGVRLPQPTRGTYTLLWIIKHYIYPDKSFEERLSFWIGSFFVFVPLEGYLVAPYLLISRHVVHPPWMFAIVLALYIFGMFLHYVSDARTGLLFPR